VPEILIKQSHLLPEPDPPGEQPAGKEAPRELSAIRAFLLSRGNRHSPTAVSMLMVLCALSIFGIVC